MKKHKQKNQAGKGDKPRQTPTAIAKGSDAITGHQKTCQRCGIVHTRFGTPYCWGCIQ